MAKSHVMQERKLTELQVLLLQCLWTPIRTPNERNEQVPWPPGTGTVEVLCGQQASLKLPTQSIAPMLQVLQQKAGFDPDKAELGISDILADHSNPKYFLWQRTIMNMPLGNSIPLTQGTWKFSAQDWGEQSLTQIGTCWLHVKKRRMSMDPR